jgi:hypothetical protein
MIRICGLLLLICLSISSCRKSKDTAAQPSNPVVLANVDLKKDTVAIMPDTAVYYERTACFGMCPIFKCIIMDDGSMQYEGRNFVDRIGTFQTNLDPTALQKIYALCDQIGYFSFSANYDHTHVMDLPSVITRICNDKKEHQIVNRYRGPRELNDLYALLDSIIAQGNWEQVIEGKK